MKSNMAALLTVLVLAISCIPYIDATHFRGGIIMFRPGSSQNQLEIDYRMTFRLSYDDDFYCDDDVIQSGSLIGHVDGLNCFDNCNANFGKMSYPCTDYSPKTLDDWSSGLGSKVIDFSVSNSKIAFGFAECCWIDLVDIGDQADWKMRVEVSLEPRQDTGAINRSPRSDISGLVYLQHGCPAKIRIPVYDEDGDTVTCRFAQGEPECSDICDGLPNANINETACEIYYEATGSTGFYPVAVQIEDHASYSNSPLSAVPLQFLVYVFESEDDCGPPTDYDEETLPDRACVAIPSGGTMNLRIGVIILKDGFSLTELMTTSPPGFIKSDIIQISQTKFEVHISWTPSADADKNNIFCFEPKVTKGQYSLIGEKRCYTIVTNAVQPNVVDETQSPTGFVDVKQKSWQVTFDEEIFPTTLEAYIKLHDINGTVVEKINSKDGSRVSVMSNNHTLMFTTSKPLMENSGYHFTLDYGVVEGKKEVCGVGSPALTDPCFWPVDTTPLPEPIDGTQSPTGYVNRGQSVWMVALTNEFVVETQYLRIHLSKANSTSVLETIDASDANRAGLLDDNILEFTTTVELPTDTEFYFTFDLGRIRANQYCEAEIAVTDTCFWSFTTKPQPKFIDGTQNPTGLVSLDQKMWSVELTEKEVSVTTIEAYIRLHRSDGCIIEIIDARDETRCMLSDCRFLFNTTTDLTENTDYYFTFDYGVVEGETICGGAGTPEITDPCFWTFETAPFPHILNGTQSPTGYVSTGQKSWIIGLSKEFLPRGLDVLIHLHHGTDHSVLETIDARDETQVMVLEGRFLQFTTNTVLETMSSYYFTFEIGKVRGGKYCGSKTDVTDPCFWYITTVPQPTFVQGSQSPSGYVELNHSTWTINVNEEFVRTTAEAYISLHFRNGTVVEMIDARDKTRVVLSQNTLQFTTTTSLIENTEYYFTFDYGVVEGQKLCGVSGSALINDPCFWAIQTEKPPYFLPGSQKPSMYKPVHFKHGTWSIQLSRQVVRTNLEAYIRMFNSEDQLVESIDARDPTLVTFTGDNRIMNFKVTADLSTNMSYYFTFDYGVVQSEIACGRVESESVTEATFWNITTYGYKLRLGEGQSTCVGIVEVYYKEEWVTVCGENFGINDAEVVCQTLGASFGKKNANPNSLRVKAPKSGYGPIVIDDFACSGTEDTIDDCPMTFNTGSSDCEWYAKGMCKDTNGDKCQGPSV